MKYCKACSKEVGELLYELDVEIIKAIVQEYPEWVGADGVCTKCLDYYRSLNEISFTDND